MLKKDRDAIFRKLDIISIQTASMQEKLDMIDDRGTKKSSEDIERLNAKVNKAAGAATVAGMVFTAMLAKIGFK